MAAPGAQHLAALKPGKLLDLQPRSVKGTDLANKFNASPVPFDGLADHLVAADIVVTSTGALQPIITRPLFEGVMRKAAIQADVF